MVTTRPTICHLITGLKTGGAERSLYNLISGGLQNAFENTVVSLTDEGSYGSRLTDAGANVLCLNLKSPRMMGESLREVFKILRIKPAIVQGWMYHGNLAAYAMQRLSPRRVPLFWNIRHSVSDLAMERSGTRSAIRLNRTLSRRPFLIVYNSSVSRLQHETLGFAARQGAVIPNGFDLTRFFPNETLRFQFRKMLGIEPSAFVFGHVARYHPMKNHAAFINAALKVADATPGSHFLMAGAGVTLSNPNIRNLIPKGMSGRFHLLGEAAAMPDVMRSLDVLALTSSWGEAFPNVIGEAMASGVPCIATDVGDCAEIIANTGRVVRPDDPQDLIQAMMAMLGARETTTHRSNAAIERIRANYQLRFTVEKYVAHYRSALSDFGG